MVLFGRIVGSRHQVDVDADSQFGEEVVQQLDGSDGAGLFVLGEILGFRDQLPVAGRLVQRISRDYNPGNVGIEGLVIHVSGVASQPGNGQLQGGQTRASFAG